MTNAYYFAETNLLLLRQNWVTLINNLFLVQSFWTILSKDTIDASKQKFILSSTEFTISSSYDLLQSYTWGGCNFKLGWWKVGSYPVKAL